MKKLCLAIVLAAGAFCAPCAQSGEFLDKLPEKLIFYIPNRILDALDTFSVNVGAGLCAQARAMCTHACDVGAGVNFGTAKLYKSYNRQYGCGLEEGWYWSLICIGEKYYTVLNNSPWVINFEERCSGLPDPTVRTYDFFEGPRDYWAVGGAWGFLIDGEVFVHPVELVDFVLGFLLIDIKNDDLALDSF